MSTGTRTLEESQKRIINRLMLMHQTWRLMCLLAEGRTRAHVEMAAIETVSNDILTQIASNMPADEEVNKTAQTPTKVALTDIAYLLVEAKEREMATLSPMLAEVLIGRAILIMDQIGGLVYDELPSTPDLSYITNAAIAIPYLRTAVYIGHGGTCYFEYILPTKIGAA